MPRRPNELIAGKYRLIGPLASGGMGSVWRARHVELEVDVAVKFRILEQELDQRAELRFKREAQAAAQLKSPNVVQIHDYGIDAGTPYIAMELLEGEDIGDLLEREERLALSRALALISQAGKALMRAHQAGIVHRDIKPSNLFLTRHGDDEILKVLDFGIAKDSGATGDELTTSAGVVLGSPTYMSPEQARAGSVDHRSDLWSLAAVLYRMLTGVPPFLGANSNDIIVKICTERVANPSKLAPHLPDTIDRFFERALARAPEQRFQSVDELVKAFEEIVRHHPDGGAFSERGSSPRPALGRSTQTESVTLPAAGAPKRAAPRRWVLSAAGALVLVAAAAWWSVGREPARESVATPVVSASESPPSEMVAQLPEPAYDNATIPEATPDPRDPSLQHADVGGNADDPALQSKPPAQLRRPSVKSKQSTASGAVQPTDPVFGLPVRGEQSTKR